MQKQFQENWDYFSGNHWPFWSGPTLRPQDDPTGEKMAQLKRVFMSCNLLGECVENWCDGLIAEPFTWYLKDGQGQRVEAAAAEVEVQRWLDWVGEVAIASSSAESDPWREFVLSLGVAGEGCLRLWQPERFVDEPDPVRRIHLHACKAGTVDIDRGDDDFIEAITYVYGKGQREVQRLEGQLLVVTGGAAADGEGLKIDTGGRWTIQQAQGTSLLSESVKKLQNSINHALTMMHRNQELSGFRERVWLNAEFPDSELERGPGRDIYAYSAAMGDENNPSYPGASIHESQPVPVDSFIQAIQLYRTLMYLEFGQGHLLSAGDGGMSGTSRIQMREGFELRLRKFKRRVEAAIANILNIVLKLLGYDNLTAVVELKITTGKLSPEERQMLIAEFQAGALSRSSLIAKLGTIGDPDAEMALIEEEIARQLARANQPPVGA
jgi:hypothetical protein